MRPCFNTDPPTFTTTVYNYLLTISVDLLSYLLGYPIQGAEVVDEADFPTVEFNENEAMHLYARDIGAYHPARLDARCLPDDLKVLHFYITRVFLPRSHGLTRIYPMDMWILARAKENRHISYPHLMIGHMMQYCDDYFYDELPFAPQITLLMRSLDLDMRYKVARVNLIDSLWDQFVLRKVNALVGRRRPWVNASGGVTIGSVVPTEVAEVGP
ncbi:unnamed protein product [Linum trigynum]|uniref:Uncharacterized protein n=1 Tax=Linum trigynum TaxID=586398 RepID=A0AAV2E5B5_9ROSI